MVARLRYLAEQSRLLYRPDTTGSYSGYVLLNAFASKELTSRFSVFGVIGARRSDVGPLTRIYLMYGGSGFTDVAAALSLITNLLATSLIALNAWCVIYIVH